MIGAEAQGEGLERPFQSLPGLGPGAARDEGTSEQQALSLAAGDPAIVYNGLTVPEPGTAAAAGVMGTGMLAARRRRREK